MFSVSKVSFLKNGFFGRKKNSGLDRKRFLVALSTLETAMFKHFWPELIKSRILTIRRRTIEHELVLSVELLTQFRYPVDER